MRIGLMVGPERGRYRGKVDRLRRDARWAEDAGLHSVWIPQIPDEFDALTAACLVGEATARWDVGDVRLVHRLGRMRVGEASVAIVVTAPHRGPACEACRFVIDSIKERVPIWKKEIAADGAAWVEGHAPSERRE